MKAIYRNVFGNKITCVCSGSLRSSSTVSKSSEGKPRLKLRSVRKLTARVERPAIGISAELIKKIALVIAFRNRIGLELCKG